MTGSQQPHTDLFARQFAGPKLYARAAAPGASDLSGGLGPYLQQEAKYSLFNKIVQKLNESTSYDDNTVGWFEVGPATTRSCLIEKKQEPAKAASDSSQACY